MMIKGEIPVYSVLPPLDPCSKKTLQIGHRLLGARTMSQELEVSISDPERVVC